MPGAAALTAYCLALGDDALIYSHRLQQWMTRLPELEEETALANIALDLLGQARMLESALPASYAWQEFTIDEGGVHRTRMGAAVLRVRRGSGWPSTPTPTSPS